MKGQSHLSERQNKTAPDRDFAGRENDSSAAGDAGVDPRPPAAGNQSDVLTETTGAETPSLTASLILTHHSVLG